MQIKRRGAALVAAAFTIGIANAATAVAGQGTGGDGDGTSSCNFGPAQVTKSGAGGTVTTSVSCYQTQTTSTPGKSGVYDWQPPKCWWEPITEDAFLKDYTDFNGLLHHTGEDTDDPAFVEKFHTYYQNTHSGDSGNWLKGYCEPDASEADYSTLGWDSIPGMWVWSPPGKPSPVGTAPTITDATLAEIAAGKIKISPTKVSMSPGQADPTLPATSTVNLPTWLWLDPKQFAAQSATAQLTQFNLSATVTAVPQELDVTVDGGVFSTTGPGGSPASRLVCPAKADGSIGTPYTGGTGTAASGCSITFLRPSPQGGSFTLHAKVVWKITWTAGTAAGGWPKTEYLTEDVPNIVVQEIETNNG